MFRLQKIANVQPKRASDVKRSRLGIGFEKLDRAVFDPEKAYDKLANIGVKWVRIQSGWARTEKEKGVYDFAWLDGIVDNLIARGLKPWMCVFAVLARMGRLCVERAYAHHRRRFATRRYEMYQRGRTVGRHDVYDGDVYGEIRQGV